MTPESHSTSDNDRSAFKQRKEELLKEHEGKFALIHGGEVVGIFDTMDRAYDHAVENFGADPVYIGRISRERDVQQAPALYHGLIRVKL